MRKYLLLYKSQAISYIGTKQYRVAISLGGRVIRLIISIIKEKTRRGRQVQV